MAIGDELKQNILKVAEEAYAQEGIGSLRNLGGIYGTGLTDPEIAAGIKPTTEAYGTPLTQIPEFDRLQYAPRNYAALPSMYEMYLGGGFPTDTAQIPGVVDDLVNVGGGITDAGVVQPTDIVTPAAPTMDQAGAVAAMTQDPAYTGTVAPSTDISYEDDLVGVQPPMTDVPDDLPTGDILTVGMPEVTAQQPIVNPFEETYEAGQLNPPGNLLIDDTLTAGMPEVTAQQPTVAGPMDYLQPDYQSPLAIEAAATPLFDPAAGITPVTQMPQGSPEILNPYVEPDPAGSLADIDITPVVEQQQILPEATVEPIEYEDYAYPGIDAEPVYTDPIMTTAVTERPELENPEV